MQLEGEQASKQHASVVSHVHLGRGRIHHSKHSCALLPDPEPMKKRRFIGKERVIAKGELGVGLSKSWLGRLGCFNNEKWKRRIKAIEDNGRL